jgi:hypothetical protein
MATIERIALALSRLYETLIKIGHIDANDVSWPHRRGERDDLDLAACTEAGLSLSAMEFLRQIPWYTGSQAAQLTPRSEAVNWSDSTSIAASRTPSRGIHPAAEAKPTASEELPPNVVALSRVPLLDESRGASFTINVDTFEVRYYAVRQTYYEAEPHPRDALDFIHTLSQSYHNLDMIPIGTGILEPSDDEDGNKYSRTRTMLHHLGWPEQAFNTHQFQTIYDEELLWRWRIEQAEEITRLDREVADGAQNPWIMDIYFDVPQRQMVAARERATMRAIVRQVEKLAVEQAAERAALVGGRG